jgi:hypothetical protein
MIRPRIAKLPMTNPLSLPTSPWSRNDKLSQHTKVDEIHQVLFAIAREELEG